MAVAAAGVAVMGALVHGSRHICQQQRSVMRMPPEAMVPKVAASLTVPTVLAAMLIRRACKSCKTL